MLDTNGRGISYVRPTQHPNLKHFATGVLKITRHFSDFADRVEKVHFLQMVKNAQHGQKKI